MEPRCQLCKHYREVWHPQPGVNWDRCKANNMESCYAHNNERNCKKFEPKLFHSFISVVNKWWSNYF